MDERMFKKVFFVFLIMLYATSTLCAEPDEFEKTPEWLKRIVFGVDAGTGQKPRIYFETVQPLYQDADKSNTYFIQPRYARESGESAFNLGLGYRKLLSDDTILLGANSFFDYEADDDHYRIGAGLEAFINQIELRGNAYIGLSPRRLIEEVGSTNIYEKAVDGFDAEAGLPLPFVNWIKIYGSGYWYNYEMFSNKEGWRIRSQIQPFEHTKINLIFWDDNKGDHEFRVDVRITVPFEMYCYKKEPKNWYRMRISQEAYPEKTTHRDKILDRVEREYKIEVEKWSSSGNATLEIKRGDT